MKKIITPVAALLACITIACNSTDEKGNDHSSHNNSGNEPKTLADSLMKDIDDGHMVGMSKIGKLHNTQKEVQRILDSIGKLLLHNKL